MRTLFHIGTEAPVFPDPDNLPEGYEWSEESRDALLWWNPATGAVKRFNSETGDYDLDVEFLHPNGLTGSRVINDKRLTFTNGILTGFENA